MKHKQNFKEVFVKFLQKSQIYKQDNFSKRQQQQLQNMINDFKNPIKKTSDKNNGCNSINKKNRRKTESDKDYYLKLQKQKSKILEEIENIQQKVNSVIKQNTYLKLQKNIKKLPKNCLIQQNIQQNSNSLHLNLGREIANYYKLQKRNLRQKKKLFQNTFEFLQKTIQSKFTSQLKIEKCGSFETNLMHSQSNLNICVFLKNLYAAKKTRKNYQDQIKDFHYFLSTQKQFVINSFQERKSLVAIKVTLEIGNEKIEIEIMFKFDQNNFLPSNEKIIIESIRQFPTIKYLFPIVKKILSKTNLDQPQFKGINSIGIVLMLRGYLQQHDYVNQSLKGQQICKSYSICETQISQKSSFHHTKVIDLGEQLVGFLYYFSYQFSYQNFLICFNENQQVANCIYYKQQKLKTNSLVICHPYNKDIILTKSFKRVSEMQTLFQILHANLFNSCSCSQIKYVKVKFKHLEFGSQCCSSVYLKQNVEQNQIDFSSQFLMHQQAHLDYQNSKPIYLTSLFNYNICKNKFLFQLNFYKLFLMNFFAKNFRKFKQEEHSIFEPLNKNFDYSIIWLHGLGSNSEEFEYFFDYYQLVPQNFRIVLLQAPLAEVTLNNGMMSNSWFDIESLDFTQSNINFKDYQKSVKILEKFIEQEKQNGLQYDQIFLGGFSQGASMTLNYALSNQQNFAGVVACSGFLFQQIQIKNLSTPLFASHGTYDNLIPFEYVQNQFKNRLKNHKNFEFYEMKNLGHQICPKTINKIKNFIKKLIK